MATKKSTAPSADAVRDKVMDFLDDEGAPAEGAPPADGAPPAEEPATAEATPPAEGAPPAEEPAPAEAAPPADEAPPAEESETGIPSDILGETHTPTEEIPAPPEVDTDPKAAHAWQTIRSENKELKAKLAELEAQVQDVDAEETAKLREQLADYEAKIGEYDLTATKEFQQKYEAPVNHIKRRVQQLLERTGKDATEAEVLTKRLSDMSLSFEQVQDLLADEPLPVQGAIVNLVTELADLSVTRGEAVKNWKDTRAALNVQQERQTQIKLAENVEQATAAGVQEAVKAGNFMYAQSQDEGWNQKVQQRVAAAKTLLREGKPADIMRFLLEGVTAADTRSMLRQVHELAETRKAELARVVGTAPRAGSGGGSHERGAGRKSAPVTPEAKVNELFADAPSLTI